MPDLTQAQQKVLDFIASELRNGRPSPTLREIASKFGYSSHRAAACHLDALKKKGFLESDPGRARALRVISPFAKLRSRTADIPLFGSVPAGLPQSREQAAEGCVTVDIASVGFTPTHNTFALRIAGDSMIGRHILNGDIVVLEHGPEPRNGQIVAALIDGDSTLKTFVIKGGKPFLKAENPRYPNLIPAHELVIQGVFKALIRKAVE